METKGIVLLGLHRSTDEQVFSRHVAKAGYKPVALFDTSAIIDMFGRTGVHACIMDLNFKHPNTDNLEPAQTVVNFLKNRGEFLPSIYMGLSGRNSLIEAAHLKGIPAYRYLTNFSDEGPRVKAFLNREEQFAPANFPAEPAELVKYFAKIFEEISQTKI